MKTKLGLFVIGSTLLLSGCAVDNTVQLPEISTQGIIDYFG